MTQPVPVRTLLKLVIAASLLLSGCGDGSSAPTAEPQPAPPTAYVYRIPADDNDGWSVGAAAANGLSVTILEDMVNDVLDGQFPNIDSVVIARNGVLLLDETIRTSTDREDGRVGNTNLDIHAQFSATKSITSLIVGIAIDAGYINGVDTPYLDLFPYTDYANWDERKNDLTLQDVLAMQLGLAWDERTPPYSSPQNQLIRFYEDEVDYSKALLDLPVAADPGTAFAYNTAATISLGQAIENSVPMALVDFGASGLMTPLGITDIEFLTTPTGLPNAGGGFYFRTRDMAKFGQLVLDGGSWNNQQIVSSAWIDASLTPRTTISWQNPDDWDWQLQGYGYQWWLGHYDHNGAELDSYVAWGFGGQWVVSIPALDLVIAINSHGYDDSDSALNEAHQLIRQYILQATAG